VGALYRYFDDPRGFKAIALLYFAAASFTETALRLGKPELVGDMFLMGQRAEFAQRVDGILKTARKSGKSDELESLVYSAIEPFDIAGLIDRKRASWFPARPADLVAARKKLGASEADIRRLLQRCGCLEAG
jgi:FADH2 O2-dependent halogenase